MGIGALEKRKQFLFFGILVAGFIGLVAFSPTIYAIVEPHITITMDPGQTTKPFVINDNVGSEVFSVDVDGWWPATLTWAPTVENGATPPRIDGWGPSSWCCEIVEGWAVG